MPQKKRNDFAVAVGLLGLGFTCMLVVSMLGASLMTMAAVWTTDKVTTDLLLLLNDVGIYGLGLPVLLAIGHFLPSTAPFPLRPVRALRPVTFARAAAVGYGSCMVVNLASLLLLTAIRTLAGLPEGDSVNGMMDQVSPWASLILISLVPAVAEELVFRGYLYRKLIRFGQLPYILISAFFFGSFHGNLDQFFYAFVLGCWLGYLVCRTGSVVYGMLIHLFINFFSSCVLTSAGESAVANTLLGACILVMAGWGLIQLWDFHRRLFVRPATGLPAHSVRAVLLNPGMILWFITFLVVCVLNLLG